MSKPGRTRARPEPEWADVTEGSGGTWERLHYDWSDPNRVVMKTTDSNAFGGDSGHTYTLTRNPDRDVVEEVVSREVALRRPSRTCFTSAATV